MENIVAFFIGLFILYIISKILLIPVKIIGRLIGNGIMGGIILFLFNIIGSAVGFYIPLTPIKAIFVGIFGVPGVIMLLVLQLV